MEVDTTDKKLFTRVTFELAQLMFSTGYTTDDYWYATEAVERRDGEWYKKKAFLDTLAMDNIKVEYLKFLIPAPKLIDAMQYLCKLIGCTITLDAQAREERMGIINIYFEGVIHKDGEEYSNENMYSTSNETIDQTLQYLVKMFAPKVTIVEKLFK